MNKRDKPQPPSEAQRLAMQRKPSDLGAPDLLMNWSHLLFVHWKFDPELIQKTLPKGLFVDTWDNAAWVGMIPFFMSDVHPRGLPTVPRLSAFLELNLRTYVHDAHGTPGVWFYTLEANQIIAVEVARRLFHLPYRHAGMGAFVEEKKDRISYLHRRDEERLSRRIIYGQKPGTTPKRAPMGSLEFYLIERYQFFSCDAQGKLYTGRVHHEPYKIAEPAIERCDSGLFALNNLPEPQEPPAHTCYSRKIHVEAWKIRPLK